MELFAELGYEATTMEQIAERADFSVRTLYNYFASKADILVDSMNERQQRVHRAIQKEAEKIDKPPAERFARLLCTVYREQKGSPDLMREVAAAILSPQTRLHDKFRPFHDRYQQMVVNLLRRSVERGELSASLDIESTAELLMIATMGIDMTYLLGGFDGFGEMEETTTRVIDVILRGLAADQAPSTT